MGNVFALKDLNLFSIAPAMLSVKIFANVTTEHINVVCNHVLIIADTERLPPGMMLVIVLMSMVLLLMVVTLVVVTVANAQKDMNMISISSDVSILTNVLMLIIPFMVLTIIKMF